VVLYKNKMKEFSDYTGKNISDIKLPENTRVIKPDTIVSMEFRQDRLNVHTDKNGKIIKQTIG
jgi:hypothetical protein